MSGYTIEYNSDNEHPHIFPIPNLGFVGTSYSNNSVVSPGITILSPADYGFPQFTTMTAVLKFRAMNSNASQGQIRMLEDNNGDGTLTAVAGTATNVTSTSLVEYTSSSFTITAGNNFQLDGRCGALAQTTYMYGAWLIITFS